MGRRPSSYVMERPGTGWNWHAKCGKDGPGRFKTRSEAEVALRLHEVGCKTC